MRKQSDKCKFLNTIYHNYSKQLDESIMRDILIQKYQCHEENKEGGFLLI